MADYPGHQRTCATCAYWVGQRDVDSYNTWVRNCADQGKCGIPYGPFNRAQRSATASTCGSYLKWPVLK